MAEADLARFGAGRGAPTRDPVTGRIAVADFVYEGAGRGAPTRDPVTGRIAVADFVCEGAGRGAPTRDLVICPRSRAAPGAKRALALRVGAPKARVAALPHVIP